MSPPSGAPVRQVLKRDLFGSVELESNADGTRHVCRNTSGARWWLGWLARRLAAREARILGALGDLSAVPQLRSWDGHVLRRTWLAGLPMHSARPTDAEYFRGAFKLLCQLHRRGVAHNDAAKEANWLVLDDGRAGLVDFQLATRSVKRGRLFRLLAHEDLRHYLKHKRTYRPQFLTQRERRILATPAWTARVWRVTGKPIYLFVTRRLLGWADREGAADRKMP